MTKLLALLHGWLTVLVTDAKHVIAILKAAASGKVVEYWQEAEAVLKDEPALSKRLTSLVSGLMSVTIHRLVRICYAPLSRLVLLVKQCIHPAVRWVLAHIFALWGQVTSEFSNTSPSHAAAVSASKIHKISGLISVIMSVCALGGGAYGAHHYYRNHHGAPHSLQHDVVAFTVIFQDADGRPLKTEHVAVGDLVVSSGGLTITHPVTGLTEHWAGNFVLLPLH
jgi:hypothetical protein